MLNVVNNVEIGVLKVHPRNEEFFDDISGQQYEQFKRSIQEEGIITPITVAPDMTIISGHQRYKAALDIGIRIVPVIINQELTDETKKLKTLLAANFGREKNNEAKQRKVIAEYVELCGYKKHDNQWTCQNGTTKLSLDEIAVQLGTSKRDLQRALSIERNLTPAMKDLLDTGVITKTLAADVISSLSENEQEQLVSQLDATKKYTQKQIQQHIDENRRLRNERQDVDGLKQKIAENEKEQRKLRNRIAELTRQQVKTEIVTKEVDKPETLALIKDLRSQLAEKERKNVEYSNKLVESSKKLSQAMGNSTNYQLVAHCSEITKQMLDFVQSMSKYDYMAESFNEIPDATRIEYQKCIMSVKRWADRILDTINNKVQIIEIQEEI